MCCECDGGWLSFFTEHVDVDWNDFAFRMGSAHG